MLRVEVADYFAVVGVPASNLLDGWSRKPRLTVGTSRDPRYRWR